MTNLTCSVTSCASNKQNCCCQHSIKVQGNGAKTAEHTCCQSFTEKGKAEVSNSTHYCNPNEALDVYCTAQNCRYHNGENKCTAQSINIVGGDTTNMGHTDCATFEAK